MARAARALGLDPGLVRANRQADAPAAEPRPADVSLDGSRWRRHFPDLDWPGVEAALGGWTGSAHPERYVAEAGYPVERASNHRDVEKP